MMSHKKDKELPDVVKNKVAVDTPASIVSSHSIQTDFQANHTGLQLAVSDSDGNVQVYHKQGDTFVRASTFKADDAAIWKIQWADPSYGQLIGLGTFRKKVAVYHCKSAVWQEIAYHELHEASVNHVEWAEAVYGLKLYGAGSDGFVSILELTKNGWATSSFQAHDCSIHCLSLRGIALNEDSSERRNAYPMLVTAGKDLSIKVWRHVKDAYQVVLAYRAHNEIIRALLWRRSWDDTEPTNYEIISASEDGSVKQTRIANDKQAETVTVCQHVEPVYRLSQSVTGSMLSASVASAEQEKSLVYVETDGKWSLLAK